MLATTPTLELLDRLVSFDSPSRNSNLGLIEIIRLYLAEHGVPCELVYDDSGTKANLYATLGPQDRAGIALLGHTDVVPVDGQTWSSDPFRLHCSDGRYYGRGTCDMKGFIAAVLGFVPRWMNTTLNTPLHLCFTYDEEVGCLGVRRLLGELKHRAVRPRLAIVGEPTEMRVITAHKGKPSRRCHVHGHACHSSLAPQGVNAVQYAAHLIVLLDRLAAEKVEQGPFDHDFDVPFSTVHTGVVSGGTALNIVPADCSFDFEIRNLPGDDPEPLLDILERRAEELRQIMRRISPEADIQFEPLSAFAALDMAPGAEVVTLAKGLVGANGHGKVAFGTEAGLMAEAGIPAVVCGPGSIAQAHKPDEFVSADQLALCERFLDRLTERAAA